MNKLRIIESKEIERILTLHNKEKNVNKKTISEQTQGKTYAEVSKFFTDAKNAGCLTDTTLNFQDIQKNRGEEKYFIIGTSQTTGNVKRVYDDYTWMVISPENRVIKSGTWKCESNTQPNAGSPGAGVNNTNKLSELKKKGFEEYENILLKRQRDNTSFYQTIDFEGVTNNKLYKPIFDESELGKSENYPTGSRQREFLENLNKAGFIANPPAEDFTFKSLKKYDYSVPTQLFPRGLQIYKDLTSVAGKKVDVTGTTRSRSIVGASNCEKNVEEYWEQYKSNVPSSGPEFDDLKATVQACVDQNMYRWKDIGGVLGIAGGSRKLDKILEVMTNKALEYEGVRQPGNGTPWALNPPRLQKR